MRSNNKNIFDFISENMLIKTLLSLILGLIASAIFLILIGINPISVYSKIISSAFTSTKSFTYCIAFAAPFIMTGLSVIFAFKAGIFNIGAEGQFVMGTLGALTVGITFGNLNPLILVPLTLITAMLAGALWGMIIAYLKNKFKLNEIISMIMFNWIALYFSNFIVETFFRNINGGITSERISKNANIYFADEIIEKFNLCYVANYGIFIAILSAIIIYILLDKTTFGYEVKAVGKNIDASRAAGINVNKISLFTLGISGGLAGIGGFIQLTGMTDRITIYAGQEGFGFGGIVVALIGVLNPIGSIFSGFFYGMLKYTGRSLNLINVPSQVVDVVAGTIILFISVASIFSYIKYIIKNKEVKK